MTAAAKTPTREKFEAYLKSRHISAQIGKDAWGRECYEFAHVQTAWEAWQAAYASLSAAPPVTGGAWREIETAPKDGTEIIGVFSNDYGYQEKPTVYGPWTIAWDGKKWRSSWEGCEVISSQTDFGTDYKEPDIEPTHWQPLPAPPSSAEKEGV